MRAYDCGHARPVAVKLRGWYMPCPGCDNGDRRARRHWLMLGLATLALLFVTCDARAADPCAPYTPIDGVSCHKPTALHYIGNAPVCMCRRPKVVRW